VITQHNLSKTFAFYAITTLIFLGLSGCGGYTDTGASTIPYTSSSIPTATSLPSNLFDSTVGSTTVPGAAIPITSTAGTSAINYTQQQCLGNSNVFFNGLGGVGGGATPVNSTNACYGSQFSPTDFYSAGLNTLAFASTCLQAILAAQPAATDPNSVAYAFAVGAMAVSRCVAQMNQGMTNFPAQWNSWQSNIFSGNNSGLFNSIQGFQPLNTIGSANFPGPGFFSGGFAGLAGIGSPH
jgi:hypothetical protein